MPPCRWLIATLAGRFRGLCEAVLLVNPDTVIRWHRAGWRLLWRWRSRRLPGRPPVDADLRILIRRMWRDNATWGENRIAGELAKLGYRVSPRTVARHRPAGLARHRGQRWATFIGNHLDETWACDFLIAVTATFRMLYVFVVLSLGRRRLVHVGVTEHPSAAWTAQRLVEATADVDRVPRFLVHDRDSIYGADFRARIGGLGIRPLATPPRAPQANAFAERMIGTLRRPDGVVPAHRGWHERLLARRFRPRAGPGIRAPMDSPPPAGPDAAIVQALRDGDERAFADLVRAHHAALVRVAMSFVPSRAIAEEVAQDTWIAALRGLPAFEGRSSLKTWLFSILVKRAQTRGVREARTVPASSLSEAARAEIERPEPAVDPARFDARGHWTAPPAREPDQWLSDRQTRAAIERAIDALPPLQRTVVTLRDVQGWTSGETCNALDISETYQRVLLHRGRSRVRTALERHFQGGEKDP